MHKESTTTIKSTNGHYEAYIDNKFICSGDTILECEEELNKYIDEKK